MDSNRPAGGHALAWRTKPGGAVRFPPRVPQEQSVRVVLQLTEEEQRRYARQIGPGVLTPEGQLRLKQSRALVTRAGGMGGPWGIVLGSLAAMAILVLLLWNPASRRGEQGDLVLYCAAGALRPVEELCAQYEQEYGVKVRIDRKSVV